ncbi:MAG: RNA methyltransferase, partial [Gammaproteobacteria bacterium]|nr:RNA methyltransferase [Gammaproteobacteria bacterium]
MKLESVRIVLVETSHPGNIGAAARAMKNMGLYSLYLVRPQQFPHSEATARASGADDVLQQAVICDSLAEALSDCHWVVGTSARERSVDWPLLSPREWAPLACEQSQSGQVAVVFGRERTGLTNEEMDLCQHLLHIPTNPDYSSLNIAAAVQVICYELRSSDAFNMTVPQAKANESNEQVSNADMEVFFQHMETSLLDIGFFKPPNYEKLQRRLRKLFFRARPD